MVIVLWTGQLTLMLLRILPHHKLQPNHSSRKFLLQPIQSTAQAEKAIEPDQLLSYCTNLCHWVLHLMEPQDTAKEGDVNRAILNAKYNIPFFYSCFEPSTDHSIDVSFGCEAPYSSKLVSKDTRYKSRRLDSIR